MVFLLGFFLMVYFLELLYVLLIVSIYGFPLLHFHITSFLCFVIIVVVIFVIVIVVIIIIIIVVIVIAAIVLCACVCEWVSERARVRKCTVHCGVFCFVEYTGCSFPCFPALIIDVVVVLLIICLVKHSVDIFTLLKVRLAAERIQSSELSIVS